MRTCNESMRGIMPLDQELSLLLHWPYSCPFLLYHTHYFTFIHYFTYYFKTGNGNLVCFKCRKHANRHTHQRGSVSIQTMCIRDSIINLQQALSHVVCFCNRLLWDDMEKSNPTDSNMPYWEKLSPFSWPQCRLRVGAGVAGFEGKVTVVAGGRCAQDALQRTDS
jgi:hypothetical protein